MKNLRNWLKSLLAHNKTALRAIGASVATSALTAVYSQAVSGSINGRQILLAAAAPVITTIAAYAKPPTLGQNDGGAN